MERRTREEKNRYLDYTLRNICVCGHKKVPKLFLCHNCWDRVNGGENYDHLRHTCEVYLDALENVLVEAKLVAE